ncbi:MAG: hypothetical protein QOF58_4824 [Pseudonocardiales bacterium]|jgi:uncharacterized protein YkwD|nr:hypothetical protein [Pseudonocardiales bacterium]
MRRFAAVALGILFCSLVVSPAQAEQPSLLDRINAERAPAGLAPLEEDGALSAVCQTEAVAFDLAPGPVPPAVSLVSTVGENIGEGFATVQTVMTSWMNSNGHRANILNPDFRHLGQGHSGTAWCADFTSL